MSKYKNIQCYSWYGTQTEVMCGRVVSESEESKYSTTLPVLIYEVEIELESGAIVQTYIERKVKRGLWLGEP